VEAHGARWTMISNVFRQQGLDRHRKSVMLRWMQVEFAGCAS
jgi:hypothetical protein